MCFLLAGSGHAGLGVNGLIDTNLQLICRELIMLYSANQTSARLMLEFAQRIWIEQNPNANQVDQERYLLLQDLYIKARSYRIINKVAFWFALVLGIALVLWPLAAELSDSFGWRKDFFTSAIVQTTITAFAGLTFAIYSHYKKRQMYTENLMRSVVYTPEWEQTLVDRVIKEMERIDAGFGFAGFMPKKARDKGTKAVDDD